ncbi:Flavonoid 3',5'-hydroxylase 1 [Camellia lanceoleosa]|uniref:Flavonoid 3',5'-hydroxylase 1 n=1 Tax=Camellia lanceoleosa TaxID=1840588 RepID=A0ACC0G525_9ERIC|nr:Flavonoid 3',5'-hydroxylase 1 [Camellia lanceoleosa]
MLWGSTFDIQEKVNSRVGAEFEAATAKMMVLLGKPNLSDFFPGLARFDLQGVEREMKKIVVDVERVFDSVIDARVKMEAVKDGGKKDFLQILLELKGEDEGEELDLSEKFGIVIKKETPLIAITTQRSSDLNFYA